MAQEEQELIPGKLTLFRSHHRSQIYFEICRNTFSNLDKYTVQYGQIQFRRRAGAYPGQTHALQLSPSLKNTFSNSYKYILQLVQIYLSIWTNTLCNMDKYSSEEEQELIRGELTLSSCHHRSHLTVAALLTVNWHHF